MDTSIAERVADLVRIPSVNPLQAGPKSNDDGERALAVRLADMCDAAGAEVVVDEVLDGRCNVYARFEGESDHAITIDAHLDTVGVEHMTRDPFDGEIIDGQVFGRGSVDTKATFAVVLSVLEQLRAEGKRPRPTVNLVGTVSEEMGGLLGALRYRKWLREHGQRINQLIVAEPTMCAPVYGHKGGVGLEVTVHGHAAHSSKPHLGQNAISGAARVITAIDGEQKRLAASTPLTPVGVGTVSVNEIDGGIARNIIPDSCQLYTGRRVAPGEDPDIVAEQLSELIRAAAHPLRTDINVMYGGGFPGFFQDPNTAIIGQLAELADAEPETADYTTNAIMYDKAADEIVVFGPGSIDQAHQAVEWVDIAQLNTAADIYRRLLS